MKIDRDVNRIGQARRRMWMAIYVAAAMSLVAFVGWTRPDKICVFKMPHASYNDCMEYAAKIMCEK